jgi:hypothetical protein
MSSVVPLMVIELGHLVSGRNGLLEIVRHHTKLRQYLFAQHGYYVCSEDCTGLSLVRQHEMPHVA